MNKFRIILKIFVLALIAAAVLPVHQPADDAGVPLVCAAYSGSQKSADFQHIIEILSKQKARCSGPLYGYVIGIDPGHQRYQNSDLEPVMPGSDRMKKKVSSGTQGRFTGVPEYEVNLQVGLKLEERLEMLGATVIMTRNTHDVDISNAQRAIMMNETDCWLRIHANGNENPEVCGMFMIVAQLGYMDTDEIAVYIESEQLAQVLLDCAAAATHAQTQGVKKRSDQTGFGWSAVPVCTIEMGYMTNEEEDWLLISDAHQDKIADGLALGFILYFNDQRCA